METLSNAQFQEISSQLSPALELLDALCHRSKNQHRHSVWWRDVGILRRAIRRLLQETSSKMRRERARWLGLEIMPSAYVSFTQLTADTQFSQLGLALIGIISQVNSALQPIMPSVETQSRPSEPLKTSTGAPGHSLVESGKRDLLSHQDSPLVDTGVAISRDLAPKKPASKSSKSTDEPSCRKLLSDNETLDDISSTPRSMPKPCSNRQNADSFDDIFDHFSQPERPSKKQPEEADTFDDIFGDVGMTAKKPSRKPLHKVKDATDAFGETAKPHKTKKLSPSDTPSSALAEPGVPEKRPAVTRKTMGFDDIFGDTTKKEKKKKRPTGDDVSGAKKKKKAKPKLGTDMSDLFGSL
ncbi:hypothetical protein BROUX41_001964 [Berkeleyomyces rouxiae]